MDTFFIGETLFYTDLGRLKDGAVEGLTGLEIFVVQNKRQRKRKSHREGRSALDECAFLIVESKNPRSIG